MNQQNEDSNQKGHKSNFILGKIKTFFTIIGVLSVLFVTLIIIAAFVAVSKFSLPSTISSSTNGKINGIGGFSKPQSTTNYIAAIRLNGEITSESAAVVIEKLEAAKDDNQAVGILFDVNSPGGSVVPSQEIYDLIKNIKETKPVVTYVRDVAASGAYYASASSSKIIANRGSIIGSIGVIMNGFEADKLFQFLKINPVVIKTGALKDSGSAVRPFNEKDKQYLQELLEETRQQFVEDVKQARKTSDSTMKFMSDGRVVLGPQALNIKLIDALGSKELAASEIANLAKLKTVPPVYYYEDIQSFSDLFAQRLATHSSEIIQEIMFKTLLSSEESNKLIKLKY